jgi:hypothetical protein
MCGALGLALTFANAAHAASAQGTCQKAVQSVVTEWNAIDYPTPSKPAAMRVAGNLGHENTAGQVEFMQNQLRLADKDCKQGNEQSALQRVSSIQNLLNTHGTLPQKEAVYAAHNLPNTHGTLPVKEATYAALEPQQ